MGGGGAAAAAGSQNNGIMAGRGSNNEALAPMRTLVSSLTAELDISPLEKRLLALTDELSKKDVSVPALAGIIAYIGIGD